MDPDWVDVFPIQKMGMSFQPSLCDRLPLKGIKYINYGLQLVQTADFLLNYPAGANPEKTLPQKQFTERSREPGSKLIVLGMVIPPWIGNPYKYINPYYWVDDHPLLYGNNGSLDPSTRGVFRYLERDDDCTFFRSQMLFSLQFGGQNPEIRNKQVMTPFHQRKFLAWYNYHQQLNVKFDSWGCWFIRLFTGFHTS